MDILRVNRAAYNTEGITDTIRDLLKLIRSFIENICLNWPFFGGSK